MKFYQYLNTMLGFYFKDNHEIPFPMIYEKKYPKGRIVTNFGVVENYCYYLKSGTVGLSAKDEKGRLKMIDVIFKHECFNSYTSFISRKKSEIQLRILEDAEVEYIRYADLQKLLCYSLEANQLMRLLTEQHFISKNRRIVSILAISARERYLNLLEKSPEVVQEQSIKTIAFFLGIHPESLCRIRKQIS